MIRASLSLLRALSVMAASVALAAQAIAVCSNAWLHSVELMPNPRYNGTGDREHLSKHTVSGLWRICYNDREYTSTYMHVPDPLVPLSTLLYRFQMAKGFSGLLV
ncbi:hypothetical protein CDAR_164911 [Caerostris darwini]|uniref:Uncharacterized protein n=1 Tax=Caerostris darwini TaxID=1538125 RepID=A0AAV4VW58_9ARAC|nr:hypothetical protein CDAR_164911 [Caerostris darwini]